jgi:hypothetical protein
VGKPAHEILAYAKEHAISLIVMGKDGHGSPTAAASDWLSSAGGDAGSTLSDSARARHVMPLSSRRLPIAVALEMTARTGLA